MESDDRPIDDDPRLDPLAGDDDDDASPLPVTSFSGAVGQLTAAVLVVVALVALFIAGAIVFRWILG